MLILPEEHRRLFKEPFGVLYRSMDEVIPLIEGRDVYTVGDVVTHNLQKKGINPAVAIESITFTPISGGDRKRWYDSMKMNKAIPRRLIPLTVAAKMPNR